jgi:thioredoxin reductase
VVREVVVVDQIGLAVGTAVPNDLGHYDVVVVGGGPAGLSGALQLGRAMRTVLVIDDEQPRNAPATHLHGYLSRDGMAGDDFLGAGRAELERYGGELLTDRVIGVVGGIKGDFVVRLASGSCVAARRLLVTSGLVDDLPEVPGLADRWGRDVLYCPYCHGWEFRDAPLGVLATDPIDVLKALLVRQWSADVALFLHTLDTADVPDQQWKRLAAVDIEVIAGPVESLVIDGDRLTALRLASGHVFSLSALFVSARPAYRDNLLTALGVATDDGSGGVHVAVDACGQTSVRGVWAAGNVVNNGDQVVNAAAAGSVAAQAINADLVFDDVDRAVDRSTSRRTRPPRPDFPFSPAMERTVTERILGPRRHGL